MLSPVPHEALRSKSGFPDGMNQISFAYILGYSKTWEMPEICRELYKKFENKKSSMLKGCISSMAADFIGKQEIQASREHATSYIMWEAEKAGITQETRGEADEPVCLIRLAVCSSHPRLDSFFSIALIFTQLRISKHISSTLVSRDALVCVFGFFC